MLIRFGNLGQTATVTQYNDCVVIFWTWVFIVFPSRLDDDLSLEWPQQHARSSVYRSDRQVPHVRRVTDRKSTTQNHRRPPQNNRKGIFSTVIIKENQIIKRGILFPWNKRKSSPLRLWPLYRSIPPFSFLTDHLIWLRQKNSFSCGQPFANRRRTTTTVYTVREWNAILCDNRLVTIQKKNSFQKHSSHCVSEPPGVRKSNKNLEQLSLSGEKRETIDPLAGKVFFSGVKKNQRGAWRVTGHQTQVDSHRFFSRSFTHFTIFRHSIYCAWSLTRGKKKFSFLFFK